MSEDSKHVSVFEEVSRFVRFGPDEHMVLQGLLPLVRDHFDSIIDTFYERIAEHPGAAAVLRSAEQQQRLRVSLRLWLERLFAGPWDDSYVELRARMGHVHVKVGLPQHYMFGGMTVIRGCLHELIAKALTADDGQRRAGQAALDKIIDLELAMMLETYHEDYVAGVRRVERLERDLLERRLAISEARYRSIVEDAALIVIAVDGDGRIVLFNRRAEHITGRSRSEVVGESGIEIVCHADDEDTMRGALAAAAVHRTSSPFDAQLITRKGEQRWVRWHVTPLAAAGEVLIAAIGVDITEEHLLAGRTQRAEHLASLGTLAAGLAHEIRNPLNAAQLQLVLVDRRLSRIEGRAEADQARVAALVVKDELSRLAGLVSDFLAYARPAPLRVVSADVCDTVRTVAALLEPDVKAVSVDFVVEAPGPVVVRFDEERIKQVLINIIRNAIEAAGPTGAVRVSVSRSATFAVLEVRDSGPGFPAGVDVFEPFSTTKDAGTGLGLSIVHRIVDDHHGRVEIGRNDGLTVLSIELPLDGPGDSDPSLVSD